MKWILVCCMVSVGHLTNGQGQGLVPCDNRPADYDGPALPTLPEQFQTHVEANIVQKNRTQNIVEYYDYPGNRGAIVSYNKTSQEIMKTVMDFNKQEARVIFDNKTCKYLKTNTSSTRFGFMSGENGTHIKSIKELLYFGEDKGEVYIGGDEVVRGIPVNHWQACVKMPYTNGTFTLDYYFSKGSGYFEDGAELQIPVRAVINGTGKSIHHGNVSAEVHSFYHIYEFFDFKPHISHDPRIFEVPVGVICNQGETANLRPAPVLSDHFSAGIEKAVLVDGKEMERQPFHLYLDNAAKVLRLDVNRPVRGQDGWAHGSRSFIHITDYDTDLRYFIDKLEQNCTVTKGTTPSERDSSRMPPPFIILDFFRDYSNFIYQGQKTWRGLLAFSWGFYNSSAQRRTEIFFHMPLNSGYGIIKDLEPIGIYKAEPSSDNPQVEMSTYEHIFGFTNGHPDPEAFDVSACYALDHHSTYLAIDVSGRSINVEEVVKYHQKEFISEIRQTVAGAAKVSVTRIASIKWEETSMPSSTITRLIVTFLLLDNKLSGVDASVSTGPSLSQAIKNLQASINSGSSMVFNVVLGTSHSVRFSIIEGSLWEVYSDPNSQQQQSSSSMHKYGPGSMAGLAIGMLVIGALLGLVAAYAIYKKIDTSVPYQVTS